MAKDPAFLFYTQDFSTGTQFFSDEQVGKYLRLLMAQHQHGHLSEKQVIHICKSYDNDIMLKFKKDSDGKFFNLRLETESEKRKNFCDSRKSNKEGKKKEKNLKNIRKSYDKHMENENENEIKDINEVKIEILQSVFVLKSENEKLKEIFGHGYNWAIETLSNYKLSSGKKYKSDYHALIGWVKDKYDEQLTKAKKSGSNGLTASDIRMAEWLRNNAKSQTSTTPPIE